ncbi:MAG: hemin uptake protein HemP [Comamonadaceae bacterium]|nr:MAG: hemin uptake protein HemP [Comamonadaceae bacterium]
MQATLTANPSASFFGAASFDGAGANGPSSREGSVAATVDSKSLLQGQKTVSIFHNGSVYRLQATKLGKLILTK